MFYLPYMPSLEERKKMAEKSFQTAKVNKCTCGAVASCHPYPATGHSDYCDILHAVEDTEEFPF